MAGRQPGAADQRDLLPEALRLTREIGPSVLPENAQAPRLTVRMVARLQGLHDSWEFAGRKTAAYRQVGNAFPPPVARAVSTPIAAALGGNPGA